MTGRALWVVVAITLAAVTSFSGATVPDREHAGAIDAVDVVEVLDLEWPSIERSEERLASLIESVIGAGGTVLDTAPSGSVLAEVDAVASARLAARSDLDSREPLVLDVPTRSPAIGPLPAVSTATVPDHVAVTGADTWHDAGHTGRGVRIGVIDVFHVPTYWNTDSMGPRPTTGSTARCWDLGADCTSAFFSGSPEFGDDHGPAVVELIRSMAPEAEIYIGNATTESDYYRLVDWFIDRGVTIVNRSLGSRLDGPGDGTGVLTNVANYAADRGITWVNSAGNNAVDRYYRHPVRVVGDKVAFGSSGGDTRLGFRGCITPGGVRWANDWYLPPAERTDYDVYLYEAPIGNPGAARVIASSTRRQRQGAPPLEIITGSRCPTAGHAFHLEVRLIAGSPAGDVLEILDFADGMTAHTRARHSAAVPVVDSRHRGVLGVGAVDPPTSGRVATYSSQGPTNDGRVKPDLVAPAGSSSVAFGETFSGTSAAAPVVAGAAALFRGAGSAADSRSLADLVRHSVLDRGARGRDVVYGTGELRMPAPPDAAPASSAPATYRPLSGPTRILDTRPASAIGPAALIGDRWPGRIIELPVSAIPGAPSADVTAVAANITVVGAEQSGFTQAFPTGRAAVGGFSNLNADSPGRTRPNLAVIPVGADGRFSVYSTSGGDLVIDVLGTFVATDGASSSGRLIGLPGAQRVLDTRVSGARTPVRSGQRVTVAVPSGVDRSQVAALVINVTATETVGTGYVQALPAGRTSDIGRTSTLNLTPGLTAANTVIVPVTSTGVELYAQLGPGGSAHLIADVTGYLTSDAAASSTAGRYVAVRPGRTLDTRRSGGPIRAGATIDARGAATPGVTLPRDVSAAVWNLTVTGTSGRGHLRTWPAGTVEPPTSALNWIAPGTTVANAAIVAPNAEGVLRIRARSGGPVPTGAPLTDVVVDLFGYFT